MSCDRIMSEMAADPKTAPLLTRQRIPMAEFFSYTLTPLSAIMFPHIAIMCMTAEKVNSFKKTVIFYPICIALFWKRSTKWGALASTLWVALSMRGLWWLHESTAGIAPKPGQPFAQIFPAFGDLLLRSSSGVLVHGYLPVLPMVLGSAFLMIVVSLLTRPPSRATVEKYFSSPEKKIKTQVQTRPLVSSD